MNTDSVNNLSDDDDAGISISQLKKDTGFVPSGENGHDVFTGVRSALMGNL